MFVVAPDLGRSARRRAPLRGNVLALISPDDGAVIATVPLSAPPTDVAAGFGSLWVSEADAGLVVRVDQNRRAVLATIPVGTQPSRIIAAGGQVWVLDPVNRTVSSIDPATNTVTQTFAVGNDPSDLALSDGSLWVTNRGAGTVVRLDPSSGLSQEVVRTGGDPSGLATTAGAVWVADDESGTVDRINARSGAVTNSIRVGDAPAAITASSAAVWVLDPLDATVSRVDPRMTPSWRRCRLAALRRGSHSLADTSGSRTLNTVRFWRSIPRATGEENRPRRRPCCRDRRDRRAVGGHRRSWPKRTWRNADRRNVVPDHRHGGPRGGHLEQHIAAQFLGMTNDGLVTWIM